MGIKPLKLVNTPLKVCFWKTAVLNLETVILLNFKSKFFLEVFMESFDNSSSLPTLE